MVAIAEINVGDALSGLGTLLKDIRFLFTGEMTPDKKAEIELKLMELTVKLSDIEAKLLMGQMEVNKEEVKAGKGGWRNAAGWLCVSGIGYNFLAYPVLAWASFNFGIKAPPVLDAGFLMSLITGMLGLGGIKAFDLYKGTRK